MAKNPGISWDALGKAWLGKGSDSAPLLCTGGATSEVLCPVLGSSAQGKELQEKDQKKGTNMVKRLEFLPYEEWLRELGLFKLRGDLRNVYKFLKGRCQQMGSGPF